MAVPYGARGSWLSAYDTAMFRLAFAVPLGGVPNKRGAGSGWHSVARGAVAAGIRWLVFENVKAPELKATNHIDSSRGVPWQLYCALLRGIVPCCYISVPTFQKSKKLSFAFVLAFLPDCVSQILPVGA